MVMRYVVLLALALLLAVVGYLLFGIVVAIYVGLWLQDDKMYYAQDPWCHIFGAAGAALGVLLALLVWRMALALLGRKRQVQPSHPLPKSRGE